MSIVYIGMYEININITIEYNIVMMTDVDNKKNIESTNIDTSVTFSSILKARDIPKTILTNMKSKAIRHPTLIQKTLFDMYGKKRNYVVEGGSNSGKTTGCILYSICEVIEEKERMSIGVVVPNHKFIVNVYSRILDFVQHSNIRLVNLDSEKQVERESGKENTTVYIGSYLSFFKCFQENRLPIEDFVSFIFDDIEYSISLGSTSKLIQLCRYLKSKIPAEKRSFFLVTSNSKLDHFNEIKDSFEVKFTNLKIVGEEDPVDDKVEDEQRADIMRTLIKQHYYIGTETLLYSCLYLVAKFEVLKGSIMIVAEDVDSAYKIKIFLDRAATGEAQVYNTEGVINIRGYNVALFNGGTIRYLIVPKEFLKDHKKNKNAIQTLKNVRNLVFFNCDLLYDEYLGFINQFKGALNLNSTKNLELGYKVLYLAQSNLEEDLKPKEALLNLMSHQKNRFGQVLFEPLPIQTTDIENFTYRVETVLGPISGKVVKIYKLMELKKNILKNVNMKVLSYHIEILRDTRVRKGRSHQIFIRTARYY